MKNSVRHVLGSVFLLSFFWSGPCIVHAQQSPSVPGEHNLKFQPQLVTKTVNIIKPHGRDSVTTMLAGTDLAPRATGQAKLKMGDMEVALELQANGLGQPGSFGTQFQTYIVWAITPAAKVFKLGAMKPKGDKFEFNTKSALRSFAIVVTVEPYHEVTRPADTIVLEVPAGNQTVAATCEFVKDGYAPVGYQFQPLDTGAGYPAPIVQMYNARRIATLAGAEGSQYFQIADEWFNSVVVSAHKQKKFTDVILRQADSATKYFEAARVKELQHRLQSRN